LIPSEGANFAQERCRVADVVKKSYSQGNIEVMWLTPVKKIAHLKDATLGHPGGGRRRSRSLNHDGREIQTDDLGTPAREFNAVVPRSASDIQDPFPGDGAAQIQSQLKSLADDPTKQSVDQPLGH
jgi:hypothetical protein